MHSMKDFKSHTCPSLLHLQMKEGRKERPDSVGDQVQEYPGCFFLSFFLSFFLPAQVLHCCCCCNAAFEMLNEYFTSIPRGAQYVCDPANMFLTFTFSATPPIKRRLGLQVSRQWETTNYYQVIAKPPRPIVMIDQSKIGNSSQIIIITTLFLSTSLLGKRTEAKCRAKTILLSQNRYVLTFFFI